MRVEFEVSDEIIAKAAEEFEMSVKEVKDEIQKWFDGGADDSIFEETLTYEILNF